MPIRCPTCSRVNPANATYCFYDGRALGETGQQGPVGLGTRPFPLPFSFSDGQGCSNYNQLVLACDRRWNEARTNLLNGTWETFFSTIGRADLAMLARHSAREADPDIGLCHLLEGLPADPEALRPPKLALTSVAEELGELEPGKDHKFQVVIENQGVLPLRGSVMTDCEWLIFGDRQGNASTKLFQTRDAYTLSVRVGGHLLRAAKKPLSGQIVIDTNGGRRTVAVRATVPIRPFPAGKVPNNVLAGARSPREVAIKAKEHPKEAAALFEQGAVKAWYESNGWTYPIQGTQARGKGALQQFFEALGLTKPPRLEIDTERITCRGDVGERLGKDVVIRTDEAKFVHAEAHSNQPWLEVLPGKSHGNSVTIPLRIAVPPNPGETLHADVTFHGNGQQRFVVPVTLTVAGIAPKTVPVREEEKARRGLRPQWIAAAAAACLLLLIGAVVALSGNDSDSGQEDPPDHTKVVTPPPPNPQPKRWWDGMPGNNLDESVARLKQAAGEKLPIFDSLEAESDFDRRQGYEQLAAKLAELTRDPAVRVPLGQFVTQCCVHEPSEFALAPLLRGLADQFPAEDREFPAEDQGEGVERAAFWLGVYCDAIAHKSAPLDRSRGLTSEMSTILGFDPDVPLAEFRDRAEKSLAERCYHNTLPTAEKSIDHALAVREVLIRDFSRHLSPDFREQDDVKLLALGLPRGDELWPKLKPLFESCVKSNDIGVGFKLVDLYAKADAQLAPKMEEVLAVRWKAAGNARLAHAARAAAVRDSMVAYVRAAKISHAERVNQLQELLGKSPQYPARPGGRPDTASLQETVRLAHASTMACLLFSKDAEAGRFDALIATIPVIEQARAADEEKKPEEPPQPAGATEVIDVGGGTRVVQGEFTARSEVDPRRGAYRKEYLVRMRAREIYYIYMRSTDMTPFIRLEPGGRRPPVSDRGVNALITFVAPADGDYRLVASSSEKEAVGRFTLQVSQQQQMFRFGGRRIPFGFPGAMEPDPGPRQGEDEKKAPQVNLSDLAELANRQGDVRSKAFKNLAANVPNDLGYRHAQRLAAYLLLTEWTGAEQIAATDSLPTLARCRQVLQALADVIANGDNKLARERTAAVVGGVLGQPPLRFDRDDDWRTASRKLLLQRALELTGPTAPATNDADRAAEFLRDLYKEQGLAFGLETQDFEAQTQLAPVLERLIKHVAARAARQEPGPAGKASPEQMDRELQAARFAAGNELEYMVLLQRIWIRVLALTLHGQAGEQNRKSLEAIPQELDEKDRASSGLLDQLRSGEEAALRVWALARDLKFK